MAIGSPDRAARLQELRTYARVQVRSGYASPDDVRRDVLEAVLEEITEPVKAQEHTDVLIEAARAELAAAASSWPEVTSYDRFEHALVALEGLDVVVLQACQDHWAADAELRHRAGTDRAPRGLAYFTPSDVWHAVEHGMLEVNVWHGDTANVRAGDELITLVQRVFADHGIDSHFDEGRLEVGFAWQRRPALRSAP